LLPNIQPILFIECCVGVSGGKMKCELHPFKLTLLLLLHTTISFFSLVLQTGMFIISYRAIVISKYVSFEKLL